MPPDQNPDIQRQAIDWALLLRSNRLGSQQQQAFEAWLEADPAHADALAEAEMAWELTGELVDSPLFSQPVPHGRSKPSRLRLQNWLGDLLRPWPAALVASLIGLGVLFGWQPVWLSYAADYQTAKGEVREVELPDASRILLGSQTAVAIHYDGQQRQVRLLRGEARFSPAPLGEHESRPFVVRTAGGVTQALGTVFMLQRENADQALVSVLEHSVRVSLPALGADQQELLQQGQSAAYYRLRGIERKELDLEQVSSWSRGLLMFENRSLAEVVDRLDQYYPGKLLLLNGQAGEQAITAAFHLDSLDSSLQMLASEHDLQITRLPGLTLLR